MRERILEEIDRSGPLPFERFMEMALYDPGGGFFATGVLRSEKAGDFLTSPEVSPAFGETIAAFVESEYNRLGRPEEFVLVEVGAGSGSLLTPLLETLSFVPSVVAVDASPAARAALAERVPDADVRSPEDGPPDSIVGVVIANELLDNLPMALAVRDDDGWSERWVGESDGQLVLIRVPARTDVRAWCEAWGGNVEPGGIVEVQLAAASWVETMAGRLTAGSMVLVDYGDTAELLEPRRAHGTLRTYRAHHLGPHPLDEPGATDITADVNFSAIIGIGELAGLDCALHRQDDYLASLGLRDRLADLRRSELELARGDDSMARLRVRSEVRDIETILHPRGLGDFRVFVGTKS